MRYIVASHHQVQPRRGRLAILLLAMLLCMSLAGSTLAWIAPGSAPVFDIEGGTGQVFYTSIYVDNNSIAHVVWAEKWADFTYTKLWYKYGTVQANGNVSWNTGKVWVNPTFAIGEMNVNSPPRIVVDASGTAHIVTQVRENGNVKGKVVHFYNAAPKTNSSWTKEVIHAPNTGDNLSDVIYGVEIVVDNDGTPYVAWAQGLGNGVRSRILYSYRLGANNWKPAGQISESMELARQPRMAIEGNGASAKIHVLFEGKNDGASDNNFEVLYLRGGRDGPFTNVEFSKTIGGNLENTADNPAIAYDSGKLYAGFIRGDINNGFKIYVYRSNNGGLNWTGLGGQAIASSRWPNAPHFYAVNDMLHMVSEHKWWNGQSVTEKPIYYQTYNPTTNAFSGFTQLSPTSPDFNGERPRIGIGGLGKVVIWTYDNTAGLRYNSDPGGASSPIKATPLIKGGAALAGDTEAPYHVTFTNVVGNPNQIRWDWDAPPTGSYQAFDPTVGITVGLPLNAGANAGLCKEYTLYTQVASSAGSLEQTVPATDTIKIDAGTSETPLIVNPDMIGAPVTSTLQMVGMPKAGRDDHIRSEIYVYNVDETCGEITSYISLKTSETANHVEADSDFLGNHWVTLAAAQNGLVTESVTPTVNYVEDTVIATIRITDVYGHVGTVTKQLFLDDDPPDITGGTLTVNNNSGLYVNGTMDISSLTVTDDSYSFYGVGAGAIPDNKAWWGLWVLVSETDLGATAAISDFMAHEALVYELPIGQTTLSISLLKSGAPGPRFIYVRALDGAGNFSDDVIKISGVTLAENYVKPALWLPLITR